MFIAIVPYILCVCDCCGRAFSFQLLIAKNKVSSRAYFLACLVSIKHLEVLHLKLVLHFPQGCGLSMLAIKEEQFCSLEVSYHVLQPLCLGCPSIWLREGVRNIQIYISYSCHFSIRLVLYLGIIVVL